MVEQLGVKITKKQLSDDSLLGIHFELSLEQAIVRLERILVACENPEDERLLLFDLLSDMKKSTEAE